MTSPSTDARDSVTRFASTWRATCSCKTALVDIRIEHEHFECGRCGCELVRRDSIAKRRRVDHKLSVVSGGGEIPLVTLATNEATPLEEARTAALEACRRIVRSKLTLVSRTPRVSALDQLLQNLAQDLGKR